MADEVMIAQTTPSPIPVDVLGPVRVGPHPNGIEVGDGKPAAVLGILVSRLGENVSADDLIDGLWGDDPPATARKGLQVHVSALRKALGPHAVVETAARGYRVDPDIVSVDAQRFEALSDRVGRALSRDPAGAVDAATEALALWRGPAYAGLSSVEPLGVEANRLAERRLEMRSLRLDARLRLGQHASVIGELEALTTDHPFREDLRRLHMLALYRSGRQAEALRAFDRSRAILIEELGVEPSTDLRLLHTQILDQDPALFDNVPRSPVTTSAGPGESIRGYELRHPLPSAGAHRRFVAFATESGREVELTIVEGPLASDPRLVRGFDAAMARIADFQHPNVVPLLDSWRDHRGVYLVEHRVAATSLDLGVGGDPIEASAAIRILDQVGDALGQAHHAGITHGQLRPASIRISGSGTALLGDFALGLVENAGRLGTEADQGADVDALVTIAGHLLPGVERAFEELDAPPASVDAVLRHAHTAMGVERGRAVVSDQRRRNPYKGLRAFHELDADDFFGRSALIGHLGDHVAAHRVSAVVGPSGSGKSSLVRAGLVPALRRRMSDLVVTDMFPGAFPFEELETALRRVSVTPPDDLLAELMADERGLVRAAKQCLPDDGTELLLVIDQFEELFSLTTDSDIRSRFLATLVAVADDERSRVRVVVTLRADFFDRPLTYGDFGRVLTAGTVPIATLSGDELAEAIREPAVRAGIELEAGLVPLLIRDVGEAPGALPLLQYALTELVDQSPPGEMTIETYQRSGGVVGALTRRAEAIYDSLGPDAQAAAPDVFRQLVSVSTDSDDSRRRVRRSELDAAGTNRDFVEQVVAAFSSFRLLTFDRDPVTRSQTVEVAHEALIRSWPRLREWVDQRRDAMLLGRRLDSSVGEWTASEHDPSFLATAGRLEQYEALVADAPFPVNDVTRAYVAESRTVADERDASQRSRSRMLRAVLVSLTAVAVVVAGLAIVQRNRADDAAAEAQAAEAEAEAERARASAEAALASDERERAETLRAEAERLAVLEQARATAAVASAIAIDDPGAAASVVAEAAALAASVDESLPAVTEALWTVGLQPAPGARFTTRADGWPFGQGADLSPDGRRAVVLAELPPGELAVSTGHIIDITTGERLLSFGDGGSMMPPARWDRALDLILTTSGTGEVRWWDPDTGEPVRSLTVGTAPLWQADTTTDHYVVLQSPDPASGSSIADIRTRADDVSLVTIPGALATTFDRSGGLAATFTLSAEIIFTDLADGAELSRVQHGLNPYTAISVSAWAVEPERLHLMQLDGTRSLIDGRTGEVTEPLPGRRVGLDPIAIAPSPDGGYLASGDLDGTVFITDLTTGEQVQEYRAHSSAIFDLAWSDDQSRLLTTDRDGVTITWELAPSSLADRAFVGFFDYPLYHEEFDDGVVLLATRRAEGELWDTEAGERILEYSVSAPHNEMRTVSHPGSGRFATVADGGGVRVYDVPGRRWLPQPPATDLDAPLAFSDDGSLLVASTTFTALQADRELRPRLVVIEVATGREVAAVDGFVLASDAVFVDNGERIVAWASGSPETGFGVMVIEATTGDIVADVAVGGFGFNFGVSPDGDQVVADVGNGELVRVDLAQALASDGGGDEVVAVRLPADGIPILDVRYTDDGTVVFTGDSRGVLTARDPFTLEPIWSVDTGDTLGQVRVADGMITVPAQAPVATGLAGGTFGMVSFPTDQATFVDGLLEAVAVELDDGRCRALLGRPCLDPGVLEP